MKGRVRAGAAFMREQGLRDRQIQSMARDSLRIEAYLTQRSGASRPADAVEQWVKDLEARADVVSALAVVGSRLPASGTDESPDPVRLAARDDFRQGNQGENTVAPHAR